jgi:hypothetical protein
VTIRFPATRRVTITPPSAVVGWLNGRSG